MGHIPDNNDYDEFMGASAEEWSKPAEPVDIPEPKADETNRWGAVQPDPSTSDSPNRWGSEPSEPTYSDVNTPAKKGNSKWWVILIIVAVVLCLCVCLVLFGLPLLGISLIPTEILQY